MNHEKKQAIIVNAETIQRQLWILDSALDAPCFRNNTEFRANHKWWSHYRRAVSALRKIEPYFSPPIDYTLFRWIMDHHSPVGYIQRFQWRKWQKLRQKGNSSLTGETEEERLTRIKEALNNDEELRKYAQEKV